MVGESHALESVAAPILASEGIRLESELVNRVCREGRPRAAVWQARRALIVTAREARMPGFAQASAALAARETPVLVRESGGGAVILGPGVIVLSLVDVLGADESGAPAPIFRGFESLRSVVEQALAPWNCRVAFGSVRSSYCDGRYNLTLGGRKFAGTAQRHRAGANHAVLAHAAVMVDCDVAEHLACIARFLGSCGLEGRFDPASCLTVRDAAHGARFDDVWRSLESAVDQWLTVRWGSAAACLLRHPQRLSMDRPRT